MNSGRVVVYFDEYTIHATETWHDHLMTEHDSLYHRIFSHPRMVVDLLENFVDPNILAELDLTRLQRENVKFHAASGEQREADVIWNIPTRSGETLYLLLLLEFQSEVAWWMAVRFQVYIGLLYQQLIQAGELRPGDKLPPVLPIVIHNGPRPWKAPTALHPLISLPEHSPLWRFQPNVRYFLLDEKRFPEEELKKIHSLTALLFRLEHISSPEKIAGLIDELVAWFNKHPDFQELRRLFVELLDRGMARYQDKINLDPLPEDLLEVRTMLYGLQEYKQKLIQESTQEGLQQGMQQGRRDEAISILNRLLEQKFGTTSPDWVEEKLLHATLEELETWTMRILNATSPGDVFIN
ncbi:MAG: Rpn family recombination-promoting nuclease/putative transposase [Magnetococcales bacterium]|nr:Rpn family recombination-promoting nuclease/putative transposase [Magnetococcales bacterium]